MRHSKRKRNVREPKKIILIVCEGETEKKYFNTFRTRYRNNNIKIHTDFILQNDSINLIKFTKTKRSLVKDFDANEKDCAWCVFDVDNNTDKVLKKVNDFAKKANIEIALSNPCIELWFLLHYKEVHSQISVQDILSKLKEFIPNYKKGKIDYTILSKNTQKAISNAKKLNETHEKNQIDLITTKSNPSTQVFKLIESIDKKID